MSYTSHSVVACPPELGAVNDPRLMTPVGGCLPSNQSASHRVATCAAAGQQASRCHPSMGNLCAITRQQRHRLRAGRTTSGRSSLLRRGPEHGRPSDRKHVRTGCTDIRRHDVAAPAPHRVSNISGAFAATCRRQDADWAQHLTSDVQKAAGSAQHRRARPALQQCTSCGTETTAAERETDMRVAWMVTLLDRQLRSAATGIQISH